MTLDEQAAAWIAAASSKRVLKQLAERIEREGEDAKAALLRAARSRGVDLPDEAAAWPAKKLLRRARGRMEVSQVRKNPIHRDEAFECVGCGLGVTPHGRSARDHCPYCLVGLHVDGEVPGDRAATCGGVLKPVAASQEKGRWMLTYRCETCGIRRRNQVLMDGDPPDDWARVVALAAP